MELYAPSCTAKEGIVLFQSGVKPARHSFILTLFLLGVLCALKRCVIKEDDLIEISKKCGFCIEFGQRWVCVCVVLFYAWVCVCMMDWGPYYSVRRQAGRQTWCALSRSVSVRVAWPLPSAPLHRTAANERCHCMTAAQPLFRSDGSSNAHKRRDTHAVTPKCVTAGGHMCAHACKHASGGKCLQQLEHKQT